VVKLDQALLGVTLLGLDTSPAIYYIEAHPRYDALVTRVFDRIGAGDLEGITSVVTLTETLTRPLILKNVALQQAYRDLLLRNRPIRTLAVDQATAARAADLRAHYGLRTPDAWQLAVALAEGCQAFLTNDLHLKRVTNLRILVLDELEL
jgi:predicted nucleic acid-binding protein